MVRDTNLFKIVLIHDPFHRCFAAFPDSVSLHSHRLGVFDHVYTFRLRRHTGPPAPIHPPAPSNDNMDDDYTIHEEINNEEVGDEGNGNDLHAIAECSHTDGLLSGANCEGDSDFLYGYVVSRVRSDPSLKRGCEQRAVVVSRKRKL